MVQPIRSPENPGTTVVSIGHLTPWPENPGYRTQVWDNTKYAPVTLLVMRHTTITSYVNKETRKDMSKQIKCIKHIQWYNENDETITPTKHNKTPCVSYGTYHTRRVLCLQKVSRTILALSYQPSALLRRNGDKSAVRYLRCHNGKDM